ncbi:MAG TPA: hypothetical protein VGO86_06675 [Candidatus Dormibacteraeota bacterium]|jgi:hypothetical protein
MNLLAHFLQSTLHLPTGLPALDPMSVVYRLIALIPLVGGYLLAREGRGNLLWEVIAVLLLVAATVVPFTPGSATVETVLASFLSRWPVMVFLLGLAFIRDGGYKIVVGVVLMAVSGLIFLPRP